MAGGMLEKAVYLCCSCIGIRRAECDGWFPQAFNMQDRKGRRLSGVWNADVFLLFLYLQVSLLIT